MDYADLETKWNDRPAGWDQEWAEFNAGREAAVSLYKAALSAFLGGETDAAAFRSQMDSLSKRENWWGFRGNSQMFFNQLVKAAEPADLDAALKAALPPPTDALDAQAKITAFLEFVDRVRARADAMGKAKPHLGRVPAFVSFFWELEQREDWPVFYPSSRDVLEQQGLLDVSETFADVYERYRQVMADLRERLGTDNWGVEHLLWKLSPQGQDEEEEEAIAEENAADEASGKEAAPPTPGDIYAGYRAQKLIFPDDVVTSFVLSLATKEFVILSGISGTGKTQIALGLAKHLQSTAGGAAVEVDEPTDDEHNFYIKLSPGVLERMRKTLRYSARSALPKPERGSSISIDGVQLEGGGTGSMRLNNIGFSDPAKEALILFFRRDMSDWIRSHARLGDYLHFHIPGDGGPPRLQIVRRSASEMDEDSKRYLKLPVRADWTDPRGLLGYFNPITEQYVRTELLDFILRASTDREHPYLVILDEMNLARVEYYFSDFLSAIESKEPIPLLPSAGAEDFDDDDVPSVLDLPPNLSFIGTVNIDETTHAFSPKVLDRANVLEFNEVVLDQALGQGALPPASAFRLRDGLVKRSWFIRGLASSATRIKAAQEHAGFTEPLAEVHAILERFNRHFGYRVVDEVSAYVGHALDKTEGDPDDIIQSAFDFQLCQKVLPKLTGGRELEEPLVHLLRYCLDRTTHAAVDADETADDARRRLYPAAAAPAAANGTAKGEDSTEVDQGAYQALSKAGGEIPQPIAYERAATKVLRMLDRLRHTGFVSALE